MSTSRPLRLSALAPVILPALLTLVSCTPTTSDPATTPLTGAVETSGATDPAAGTDPNPAAPRDGRASASETGAAADSSADDAAGGAADSDVDGDGEPDELALQSAGTLRVNYSAGGGETVLFDTPGGPDDQRLLGTVDVDRDGHAEVFVRFVRGSALASATLFRYVDGHLRLVTLNGEQTQLPYGASLRGAATWECRPTAVPGAVIATWSASADDGSYRGDRVFYAFSGATLVEIERELLVNAPPGEVSAPECSSLILH